MAASYRKASRPLVLARAERAEGARAEPSDDDFTVLLAREPMRPVLVPPPPRDAPAPRVRPEQPPRQTRAPGPAPVRHAPRLDPDQTGPATASSVAPPPTTVTVAPPVPIPRAARRRARQALVAGALAFLSFGCLSGIGVEIALRGWGHGKSTLAVAAAASPPPPATVVVAASPPAIAPAPAPAADTAAPRWTSAGALTVSHPAHHRRKHHRVHTKHLADPEPPSVVVSTPPSPPDPDPAIAEYPLSPDSQVAAAPATAGTAQPDEMAAAQQMLIQAKAEEAL